ncbi:MAG: metalloregulator ArsR/SmtB family transcription factor [Eubacteriales bacterium]|nr:metalloregulator ArsR/SmtB family transcription factor [Eubacteriales bacterium]
MQDKYSFKLKDEIELFELAELFKNFADTSRIKILVALLDTELCVNDIAEAVELSQSAVSHQLRILKSSRLVRHRREGKQIFYTLDDDHVKKLLEVGFDHLRH